MDRFIKGEVTMISRKKILTLAVSTTLAGGMIASSNVTANNFLDAAAKMLGVTAESPSTLPREGKCGGDKGKNGQCGGNKIVNKAKEGKCGEGKCGGDKAKEGKCGEGKCGGGK